MTESAGRSKRSGAVSHRRRRSAPHARILVAGASTATALGLVAFLGLTQGDETSEAAPTPAPAAMSPPTVDGSAQPTRRVVVVRRQNSAESTTGGTASGPRTEPAPSAPAAPSVAPQPSQPSVSPPAPVAQSRGSN